MKTVSRLIKREATVVPQEHAGEGWLPHVDTVAARVWKYRAGQGGIVGKPLLSMPLPTFVRTLTRALATTRPIQVQLI